MTAKSLLELFNESPPCNLIYWSKGGQSPNQGVPRNVNYHFNWTAKCPKGCVHLVLRNAKRKRKKEDELE